MVISLLPECSFPVFIHRPSGHPVKSGGRNSAQFPVSDLHCCVGSFPPFIAVSFSRWPPPSSFWTHLTFIFDSPLVFLTLGLFIFFWAIFSFLSAFDQGGKSIAHSRFRVDVLPFLPILHVPCAVFQNVPVTPPVTF